MFYCKKRLMSSEDVGPLFWADTRLGLISSRGNNKCCKKSFRLLFLGKVSERSADQIIFISLNIYILNLAVNFE